MSQPASPGTDDSVGLAGHAGVNSCMTQSKAEVGVASIGGQAADHVAGVDESKAHRNTLSPKRLPGACLVRTRRYHRGDGSLTHPTPLHRPTGFGPLPPATTITTYPSRSMR